MAKKFFLFRWLDGLFKAIGSVFNKLDDEIKNNIDYVIDVVNRAKADLDETALADLITYLIPGDKDDKFVAELRAALPDIIIEFVGIRDTPDLEGQNAKLLAAINAIKISPDNPRGRYWRNLAALLVERLSDGKLDIDDATIIATYIFKNRKRAAA